MACSENKQNPSPIITQQKSTNTTVAQQQTQGTESQVFRTLMDEYTKKILRNYPTGATSLGLSEDYLGMKFNDKIGDYSVKRISTTKKIRANMSADLAKINRAALTGTEATTFDVVVAALTMTEKFEPYVFGGFKPLSIFTPYPITQLSGIHLDLPRSLQTEHPLATASDIEDYLTRLSQLGRAFTEHAEVVKFDTEQGVTPPQFAIKGALNGINGMTQPLPINNPLAVSLGKRLTLVSGISQSEREAYVERAAVIISEKVYPGYAVLGAALTEILPKAQIQAGIWALADGDKLYELALQNYGAGDKTPEQVHQLGLSEVKRVQTEIDVLLKSVGRTEGEVMTRFITMTEDPDFLYANTDQGRATLLADLNTQMQKIETLLPNILLTLPKAKVEVRRIAEYEQDSAPGGYYTSPSIDGSRPGIYWINLKDTADWPSFSLPTLTYHEASPGHHLQSSIALEIKDMPMIRNTMWFSPYGEGWALYAELLAKELGLYKGDAYGDLGRLQSELFRSARLVVDTGIHYKRWTREQAIDWMHKNTGDSVASVTREIERYSVWPGQATSYKMGQIRILELRALAKDKLANKFELRKFNDQVLIHGSVPLPVLTNNIHTWIDSKL